MFDAAVDQAAGLRRLFRTERSRLIPAGCLVPEVQARAFIGQLAAAANPDDTHMKVVDRKALYQWLHGAHADEAAGARRRPGGQGPGRQHGEPAWVFRRHAAVEDDVAGADTTLLFWLDDPVEMARWVHAQAGDRLLLILSHRRDAMMAQYAKIKHIAATTGIRRFGVLFVDVEQVARGRETFLNLAGCARRFLSVQLDVVVGSCHDEAGLRTWSGLSMAELAQFQWSTWSGAGMPALEENGFSGGVAH